MTKWILKPMTDKDLIGKKIGYGRGSRLSFGHLPLLFTQIIPDGLLRLFSRCFHITVEVIEPQEE